MSDDDETHDRLVIDDERLESLENSLAKNLHDRNISMGDVVMRDETDSSFKFKSNNEAQKSEQQMDMEVENGQESNSSSSDNIHHSNKPPLSGFNSSNLKKSSFSSIHPTSISNKKFSNLADLDRDFEGDAEGHVKEGVRNFLTPAKKRKMVDKSTCVQTKAFHSEENLFALKQGSSACINITILCKVGGNTLYIVAKWKDKEYHGVLTDGEPVLSHVYAQKRSAPLNGLDKNSTAERKSSAAGNRTSLGSDNTANNNNLTASGKPRGKRGGRVGPVEKRIKHMNHETDNQNNITHSNIAEKISKADSTEKCFSDGNLLKSNPMNMKLFEINPKNEFIRCSHQQCGYRFESINELNSHMIMCHVNSKAKMFDSTATQTTKTEMISIGVDNPSFSEDDDNLVGVKEATIKLCSKCKNEINSDLPANAQKQTEEKSLEDLFNVVRATSEKRNVESKTNLLKDSNNSPGAFSDISDDGAPTLEKEENFEKIPNSSSADTKKVPVNEQITILTPPTVVVDPALDILSPVMTSKSSPRDTQILASGTIKPSADVLQKSSVISPTSTANRKMEIPQNSSSNSPTTFSKAASTSQDVLLNQAGASSDAGGTLSSSANIPCSVPATFSTTQQSSTTSAAANIPTSVLTVDSGPFNTKSTASLLQQGPATTTTQFPPPPPPPTIIGGMPTQMAGNPYTSPFHPNFLNPSFLQAAQAAASMQAISKSSTPISAGIVPSFVASGSGQIPTSQHANFNGFMPSVSTASPATTLKATPESQQQQNRHKIHELKASAGVQNSGSSAMLLGGAQLMGLSNNQPSSSTNFLQLIIPPSTTMPPSNDGNNGGGRSSANNMLGGASCSSSSTSAMNQNQDSNSPRTPLRAATALPSVGPRGVSQQAPQQMLHSSSSTPNNQFLFAAANANNIPGGSPVLNPHQQMAFLQHQQFQQQVHLFQQMRQSGFPPANMFQNASPEQISYYASIFGALPHQPQQQQQASQQQQQSQLQNPLLHPPK